MARQAALGLRIDAEVDWSILMPADGFSKLLSIGVIGASIAVAGLEPASAEVKGRCSKAVGTFLTTNTLDTFGRTGKSRSILVLTNGGHAIRFDSDEDGAAMDSRPFGDSAGTWRCDGVDKDGTVRLTAAMLDFSFPDAEGDDAQIARIDVSGTYTPKTDVMELTGKLGFLPIGAEAQKADALLQASNRTTVTLRGLRIELPEAKPAE